jgi:hypothetical protein
VPEIRLRPTGLAERVLAPDLARGVMLLFIALANSHYFLQGPRYLVGFPLGGSALDAAVASAIATLVDGRAFPLFSVLFGYGVVQLARRQQEAGTPWKAVSRLVRRRSLWMMLIGFLHCVLLYVGDIVAAYGFLALLLVGAVRWKEWVLLTLAGLMLVVLSLPSADDAALVAGPDPALLSPDPVTAFVERAAVWPLLVPVEAAGLLAPFLLGYLVLFGSAARDARARRWALLALLAFAVPAAAQAQVPTYEIPPPPPPAPPPPVPHRSVALGPGWCARSRRWR